MSTITAYGHTIEVESLPAKSLEYLLTYGFKQAVADASAGPASEAKRKGESEDAIQAIVDAARAKRVEAILNGTVGIRAASTASGMTRLERMIRSIGMEALEAMAKAKGLTFRAPKGADEATREALSAKREQLFEKLLVSKRADWEAEALRRLAATVTAVDDADDLFAGLTPADAE